MSRPIKSDDAPEVNLPAHKVGLPGKEAVCFFIASLIPAFMAGLAGCAPGHRAKKQGGTPGEGKSSYIS
jgi:hypothetical protein